MDPSDLLTQRQVLLQVHQRRSAGLGEASTDKRVRVLQVLHPARDGRHGRVSAASERGEERRQPGVRPPLKEEFK